MAQVAILSTEALLRVTGGALVRVRKRALVYLDALCTRGLEVYVYFI